MASILNTIKKMIGFEDEYTQFDTDLIIFINSAFSTLTQVGVGPEEGFKIRDETAEWDDFLDADDRLEFVKEYVYLKVRSIFDPPSSSSVLDAYKSRMDELIWRINVSVDPGN